GYEKQRDRQNCKDGLSEDQHKVRNIYLKKMDECRTDQMITGVIVGCSDPGGWKASRQKSLGEIFDDAVMFRRVKIGWQGCLLQESGMQNKRNQGEQRQRDSGKRYPLRF